MYPVKSDLHSSGEVWRALRAAAPQTVPVFAGYLVLGMGYASTFNLWACRSGCPC